MSRLDDLRQLEADAVALKPRACGCAHELKTSATGVIQFCPLALRRSNPICYHRPDVEDVRKLIVRAIILDLLDENEGQRFLREDEAIQDAIEVLDLDAQLTSEDLEADGALDGITDFSEHWLTNDIPVSARRFATRGRPPFGLGGSAGNNGSIRFHNSSVSSGLAISCSSMNSRNLSNHSL